MIISHRGKGTGEAENTIPAFEKAFEMGAGGIECDLRLATDSKVIVSHDRKPPRNPLTLDELFNYIKIKRKPFFLEVKNSSSILVRAITSKIEKENLWEIVHVIGFSVFIKAALKLEKEYPKLRVMPFVNFPPGSFVRLPQKCYGLILGWLDDWPGSQLLFRTFIPVSKLRKLRERYEKNGFKVMAGVINNRDGMLYFKKAGIIDIITDEIELASKILKS